MRPQAVHERGHADQAQSDCHQPRARQRGRGWPVSSLSDPSHYCRDQQEIEGIQTEPHVDGRCSNELTRHRTADEDGVECYRRRREEP